MIPQGGASGRTLDERLAIAWPSLWRLAAARVLRLPPGSSLRARIVKRLIARSWLAFQREDDALLMVIYDPSLELTPLPPPIGFAERYVGHQGWSEFARLWRAEWTGATYAPQAIFDLGEVLAVRLLVTTHGSHSGVQVTQVFGQVFHLAGARIVRQESYLDWADCAAALGLPRS